MIHRMQTIFSDVAYQNPETLDSLNSNPEQRLNIHAFTLVVSAYVKVFELILEAGNRILATKKRVGSDLVRQYYIAVSKTFLMDFCAWVAMVTPKEHVFWVDESDPRWLTLNDHLEVISLGPDEQVLRDWDSMSGLLSTLFAGMSKGQASAPGVRRSFMNFASMGYYFMRSSKKEIQTDFYLSNPGLEVA